MWPRRDVENRGGEEKPGIGEQGSDPVQLSLPVCFFHHRNGLHLQPPGMPTVQRRRAKLHGFFLRIEKDTDGHLVRVVEKGSPAEKAGLLDGDRVLRINGTFVDKKEHVPVGEAGSQGLSSRHSSAGCDSGQQDLVLPRQPLARRYQ